MCQLRNVIALLLLLTPQLFAAPPKKTPKKDLATQIHDIVTQPQLASAHWGIVATDLQTGKVLYSLNPDQLFLPASNAKLITTAAALAAIGPDYRVHTTVETTGKIQNGILAGDLVIMGRGDANISGRVLPYQFKSERIPPHTQILGEMADQVARSGLKEVQGDLLGDDTFFSSERYGEGWALDDIQWIDGAPVSALSFNDNVVFIKLQPAAAAGEMALATLDPQTDYYQLDNRVVTSPAGVPRKIGIHRDPGSKKVVMWGSLPVNDAGVTEAIAIEDPAEFTAQIFRAMLLQRGITVTGTARARHGDTAQFFDKPDVELRANQLNGPPAALPQVLAEHVSVLLLEDLRVINKTSQNLHAELALRLLSKVQNTGGSFEGGALAVKQFLLQAGIKEEDFFLLDGSGLSRRDLITPQAMAQLLTYAARQPWGHDFEDTLPVAGVDGSLSERLVNSPAAGLVHAKTGTLSHVNALSGYGQTLSGKHFAFSIFCNNHDLPSSKVLAAMDSIVQLLVTQGAAPKQGGKR
jgi:D-alanyl-D-alanine carboxypeptidase/D-alanyl-D-alanine-endopeptidase (penicillin-binding protein 4)